MTFERAIRIAEKRLDEAIRNGTVYDQTYWRGYRDGVKRAVENEEEHK